MSLFTIRGVLLLVSGLLIVAEVQAQDPGAQNQTYRDMFAGGVSEGHRKFSLWSQTAFDWHTNPTGGGISHVADDVLESWERNHTRLTNFASKAMDHKVVRFLGAEMLFASSYGTVGGHLYEGNLQSAGVAALDELAKTGAAYAGAKVAGGVGATYGFAIAGPPGMMVGGLIGAVGGAAAAVWGYNTAVSPTVTGTYEKLLEPDRDDYLNEARKNLHDFRVLQATRKLEEQLARDPLFLKPYDRQNVDYLMRHTPGLQPPSPETSNIPQLSAPGADDPDRWKDLEARAKWLAKEAADNPLVTKEADPDAVPVIPEVAVIDVIFVNPDVPDSQFKWSLYRRGDSVSGICEYAQPGVTNKNINGVIVSYDGMKGKYQFEGSAKDNIFSGSAKIDWSPTNHSARFPDGRLRRTRWTYTMQRQQLTFAFYTNGTVTMIAGPITGTGRFEALEGRGENEPESEVHDVSSDKTWTVSGVWQYREAPVKAE